MGAFYDNYVRLCNSVNKSPSAVALEIGLSKTAVSGWKNGRSNPTDATIQRIADYFGATVEDLTAEQKEKPTAGSSDELDETTRRLLDLFKNADEQKRQEMLNYAEYLLSKQDQAE